MKHLSMAARLGLPDDDDGLVSHFGVTGTQPTESIVAAWVEQPDDGWPMAGVSYRTDFDASQEFGIVDLRKAVTGPTERDFTMTRRGREHIKLFTDVNGFVISKHPREFVSLHGKWDDLNPWGRVPSYVGRWEEMQRRPERWAEDNAGPAPFVAGNDLVIRADEGPLAEVVAELRQAIKKGTFGFAPTTSGPFSTGCFLADMADMGPKALAQLTAQWDWHDARMADLEPVAEALKAEGINWYALGRPQVIDGVVKYWLNGMANGGYRAVHKPAWSGRDFPQPFGWYTLDELAEHKFIDDAINRKKERDQRG